MLPPLLYIQQRYKITFYDYVSKSNSKEKLTSIGLRMLTLQQMKCSHPSNQENVVKRVGNNQIENTLAMNHESSKSRR